MKQEEKTHAQLVAEQIKAMPVDPEYRPANNLPIPLQRGVLAKKIKQSSVIEVGGIILLEGEAENSRPPHLGIIVALGPGCSEYLKLGQRVYYNFYCDSSFIMDGIEYAKLDESDVFYIVPPKARVNDGVKSEKEVKRTKAIVKDKGVQSRIAIRDANEKDQYKESIKKRTKTFVIGKNVGKA